MVTAVDMHGQVVVPRLARHHVGDFDVAAFEFAGRGINEPVLLGLPMNRLRVEQHNALRPA